MIRKGAGRLNKKIKRPAGKTRSLKKIEEQVKELNLMKNRFIAIVSHQLRTPLNVIRWNLESVLKGDMGRLTDAQREILQIIYEAELNVISRLKDLFNAIDIEEGMIIINKKIISIEGLVKSVISVWEKQFQVKNIEFKYLPPPNPLPPVSADADKIRMIFSHLLNNAFDYTNKKGQVIARLSGKKGFIRFELTDNGIGIPKIEQTRIFKKFYRASNASSMSTDRSGISLSSCEYYIKQHGGKIGFKSEERKGSTFWFELPIVAEK